MAIQDFEDWSTRVYWDYYFTILQDTPESYEGTAGYPVVVNDSETGLNFLSLDTQGDKYLRVKSAEDGIEFVDLALTFLLLTDTPGDYTGHAGEYTKVKSDESGLEFVSQPGIPSGTKMLFKQGSAPAGWTFVSEDNDRVILNSSTEDGGETGGSWTISGLSVAGHALSSAELPAHKHSLYITGHHDHGMYHNRREDRAGGGGDFNIDEGISWKNAMVSYTGGNNSHSHGISQNGSWRPAYVKVITCQKD